MKIAIAILLVLSFSTGCEKGPFISLHNYNKNKIIALQPFGNFDEKQLAFIRDGIITWFHTPVHILKPACIPAGYSVAGSGQYSADSLIRFLLQFINDTIVDVVGLTHEDIYAMHERKTQEKNFPPLLYEPGDIFGYGYVSGNSCVVSDYRLRSNEQELSNKRLLKVIIHEIGHNLGLLHCSNDTCIMFEGDMRTLDTCNGNFCSKCRQALQ